MNKEIFVLGIGGSTPVFKRQQSFPAVVGCNQ